MSGHRLVSPNRKTLAESAACFACAIAGLTVAAIAMKWVLGLIG
jgi:hypothetical protein